MIRLKKQKLELKTPEKDLKNIRIFLGNSIKEFSRSVGISEEDLINIEKGKRKLTEAELSCICSVIMNTIVILVGDNVNNKIASYDDSKKEQITSNRNIIIKALTNFINLYNPANKKKDTKIDNQPSISYVQADGLIDPNRYDKSQVKTKSKRK